MTQLASAPARTPIIVVVEVAPAILEARTKSRSRKHSSRTALGVGLGLFLAILFGFDLLVRHDLLPLRDPIYSEKFSTLRNHPAFFQHSSEQTRLLAVGSSRLQLAFDAERYSRATGTCAFNFGSPGAGPLTSALYWRRLREAGVTTDCLLVEIHPGLLEAGSRPLESYWLQSSRLRPGEAEFLTTWGRTTPVPLQERWYGPPASLWTYRFSLLNLAAPKMLPSQYAATSGSMSDRHGHIAGIDFPASEKPRAMARAKEQYARVFAGYQLGGAGPTAIKETVFEGKRSGAQVILVVMPESPEFRSWYGESGNAAIAKFCQEFPQECEVPLINARCWLAEEEFADGHHLTSSGAVHFTDRLMAELKRIERTP